MERAIGEIFEFEGKKLIVIEEEGCENCEFKHIVDCCNYDEVLGACSFKHRKDNKNAAFKLLEK